MAQQLSFSAIRAVEAWSYQTGSSDVVVAILDSGMDAEHPDLVENLWTNAGEIPANAIDDDGNGYADDVHGWDFVDGDSDPGDRLGRGTHLAGIVGARGGNGIGMAGVAWNVSLLPVRVTNRAIGKEEIPAARAAEAIRYAADLGAHVILVTFYVKVPDEELLAAIRYAVARDAVVVAASGDHSRNLDKDPLYPAAWDEPGLITVASVDQGAKVALSSNFGKRTVAMVAPGVNVFSTLPGGYVGPMSGTAQAAAHVAGAVALFRSHKPLLTAPELAIEIPRLSSNRTILEERCRSASILDLGLLIAEKRDTVDARIIAPHSVRVGEQVVFDGSMSEGPIVEYLWKFGDPLDEFGPVVPRRWSRPGTVGVELIVRTFDGRTASIATEIEVRGNDELSRLGCAVAAVPRAGRGFGAGTLAAGIALGFAMLARRMRAD